MTGISEDEIAQIYKWALQHANGCVQRPAEAKEGARDAATDGVVWAINNYDPAKGPFRKFAQYTVRLVVRLFMGRTHDRRQNRPPSLSLSSTGTDEDGERFEFVASDHAATGRVPMGSAINDLPEELQSAIRFYFVDGYSFRDCAMLLGCSAETVRFRLQRAAEILKPDGVKAQSRGNGIKRYLRRRKT